MARKGENIYRRKDKRWEARYIRGRRPDGRARYGYCYAGTYAEVRRKRNEAEAALTDGRPAVPAAGPGRFSHYCDEWLRMSRTRVKESTFVKYRGNMEKHVKPRLGGCPVRSLSSAAVEEFSYGLLSEDRLSPKTVRDILTMLKGVLRYTAREAPEGLRTIDIVYPKETRKETRVLTLSEQERFIGFLRTDLDDYKFGMLLGFFTGMRIGEVCALRWKDVSMGERVIRVGATMQRLRDNGADREAKTRVVITDPKSGNSVRVIPMTDNLTALLRTRKVRNREAFVLTGDTESYIEPRSLQYRFRKYAGFCGIEGASFHTLRHTFATRCVEVGFDLKSLSEILGHSSPRVTLERYVHSSMELKRNNMKKLETLGL